MSRCTCQTEQYYFCGPILIWKDKDCPVHNGAKMNVKTPTIKTEYVHPPIGFRGFDWAAWIDGEEDGVYGRGETENQAIADLQLQLELVDPRTSEDMRADAESESDRILRMEREGMDT